MRLKILFLAMLILMVTGPVYSAEVVETFATEPVFDTKVRLVEAGRDKPLTLILVHGIGPEGAEIWEELIPELALEYHVVACDLPGFGKSDQPNVLYSPEQYSKFLEWLVKRTVSDRFILAGHSLGGALALHYTATAEVKPDKLILIDVAGILHRAALTKYLLHLKIREENLYVPPASLTWIERLLGTMVEKLQGVPVDFDLILRSELLRETFLNGDPAKISGLALMQEDFTPLIDKVETPAFLIWGENDDIAPIRTGHLLAERLKQAQLELIPDGGHTPMRRQQGSFRQAFKRALDTLPVRLPAKNEQKTDRTGSCRNQKDTIFSGNYRSIELFQCQNIQLADVVTQELNVFESDVTLVRTRIDGGDIGLNAVRSRITATVLNIEAELPIRTDQSHFDFAGATLKSRGEHLVVGEGNPSRLLFSVSKGIGPHRDDSLHDVVSVTEQQPLW